MVLYFQVLECSRDLRVLEAKVEEARKNSNSNGNVSGNRNSCSKEGSTGENENDKFVETVEPFLNAAKVNRGDRHYFLEHLFPLDLLDLFTCF